MRYIAKKSVKKLIKLAESQGWDVKQTKKGWMFYPPDKSKQLVLIHNTESDKNALPNTIARLKRSGLVIE